MQSLSEATAVRLFNSVVATAHNVGPTTTAFVPPIPPVAVAEDEPRSLSSVQSANEFGNSCRICRWNRSDMQILRCPCRCRGSVGFVHLQCLRRWIMHRRDSRCEICNMPFEIPDERVDVRRMIRSFMSYRCIGAITKHLFFSISLLPLAHVVLQQLLLTMENLNTNAEDQLGVRELMIASCALLTSSALFFHFFEFITTRFMLIRSIIRQWWYFGNTSEFSLLDIEIDSFEVF